MPSRRQPKACPPPGVYADIPDDQYHRLDAVNASTLKQAGLDPDDFSMAAIRHHLDGSPEPAGHWAYFGRAAHAALLEPDRYEREVWAVDSVVNPLTNRTNKLGELADGDLWAIAHQQHPDRLVVATHDRARIDAMVEVARAHPRVATLLGLPSLREISLVWDDARTGLRCKGRLDWAVKPAAEAKGWWGDSADTLIVVDYKTTRSARRQDFERDIRGKGYYLSAALYRRGVRALLGRKRVVFLLIAQEKTPPFDIALYGLDDDWLTAGDLHLDRLLAEYARCLVNGQWPGLRQEIHWCGPPQWLCDRLSSPRPAGSDDDEPAPPLTDAEIEEAML